jgi:SAM-dependent methyltransferase
MVSAAQACISCGAMNHKLHFEAFGYAILECGTCGLAFTDTTVQPETSAHFYQSEYYARATAYAESLRQNTGTIDRHHQERIRTVSRLARRKDGYVLDVGCAAGSLLAAFKRAGWHCFGIEPAREMAALARISAGCEILESTLETSGLPRKHFDVVAAVHVLEHSPDPRRFLDCCFRLLKEQGVLLLEVPDFGSRRARAQGNSWLPLYPDTHFYHFTAKSLSELLEKRGFRVARVRRYGGLGAISAAPAGGIVSAGRPDYSPRRAGRFARLERCLFQNRDALRRLPFLMQLLRHVYWQTLKMNESLRVYAIRAL